MRIAVIGSGNIGGTLGSRWAAAGHEVIFGVRDPDSARAQTALGAAGANARLALPADAAAAAEVVLLAVPGAAAADAVAALGNALAGRLVIDATNRFGAPVMNALAAITAAAPAVTAYRAFNSIGWENMAEPVLNGIQLDLLFCGPDGDGRATVERLITDLGLRPVYAGGLEQAPAIDALGALWGALVFGRGLGRRLAFKVVTP